MRKWPSCGIPITRAVPSVCRCRLYDMECPDPLRGGLMGRAVEFYEYMHERCRNLEFEGLPVRPPCTLPGASNDGPLDAAYKLRGAGEVCLDMLTDPAYYHDLMTFITDGLIRRHVRNLMNECGHGGGFALGSGNSIADYVPVENYLPVVPFPLISPQSGCATAQRAAGGACLCRAVWRTPDPGR